MELMKSGDLARDPITTPLRFPGVDAPRASVEGRRHARHDDLAEVPALLQRDMRVDRLLERIGRADVRCELPGCDELEEAADVLVRPAVAALHGQLTAEDVPDVGRRIEARERAVRDHAPAVLHAAQALRPPLAAPAVHHHVEAAAPALE